MTSSTTATELAEGGGLVSDLLLDVFVSGMPVPQGSKRYLGVGSKGKVRMAESSKKIEPWRADIRNAVEHATTEDGTGPTQPAQTSGAVAVELHFQLPRPAGHWRTGRNAGQLRDTAPAYPAGRPDLDKLVRAALDAIGSTGRVWTDDAQVAHINTWKTYAVPGEPAGVQITVRSLA